MLGLDHLAIGQTFNRTLTLTVLLIAISQFNYGFDQQGFNSTQAITAFTREYGTYNPKTKTYTLDTVWLSMFTALPLLGMAVGILGGSMLSSRLGRRVCVLSMSLWSLIATTIVITSSSANQILAGRVLLYVYIGMQLSVVPIYQAEITPRRARGFVVGTFQFSLSVGGLVINGVARGTSSLESAAAFRIPYGLFYIVPSIVICGAYFIPESPRWLTMKGRDADALASLTRLRKGCFTPDEINEEMRIIKSAIDHEVEKGSFMDMFRTPQTTKRTIAVVGTNFFMQANGYQITAVYGAIFVKSLGFIDPFTFTVINGALQVVLMLFSMVLMDKFGRRQIIFAGATLQGAAQFAMGGLGIRLDQDSSSVPMKTGIVVALFLLTCGFTIGWAPTGHVLSSEIPSIKLRDVTYRTASVLQIMTQFAVTFSLPYLLNAPYADLGAKVGFMYGSITFLSLVFCYFCVPECKGRTLEDIDALFEAGYSVRHFSKVKLEAPFAIGMKQLPEDHDQGEEQTKVQDESRVA